MHEKIDAGHLGRRAILYIRQSSAFQVEHNQESQRLQYAMEQRLRDLGWSEVEVIDEDLGRSAAGGTDRSGFQRMVAGVCLGQVGAVAAREVSRFARNSRDWQQLVEVCRLVDTLLIDHETVYDARRSNDRLLLGLKGSLNEYELDLLRQRSWEARRLKASRGELVVGVPTGYVRDDERGLVKDPDRRVRHAIELVYRKFLELGSVRQVLLWLIEHGVELPSREARGRGEVRWRRPRYAMVHRLLTNPVYGGTYAFGRSQVCCDAQSGTLRRRTRRRSEDQWLALIPGRYEGYVDWEQFQRVQAMISGNAQGGSGTGAAKRGSALLAGLVRCRRCGRKLTVAYTGRCRAFPRYVCRRGQLDNGDPKCISFGGSPLDEAVAREVLELLRPGAMAAVTAAAEAERRRRDELDATLRLDLQAARYAADRARRQFDAVDPQNRLVADALEQRWNEALERVRRVEQRLGDRAEALPEPPDPAEFEALARDLPRVWRDPETDVRLKKRLLRAVIREVVVDLDRHAGQIRAVVHWKGGAHTELAAACRRRGHSRLHTPASVVQAVERLRLICTDEVIAGVLNRNGMVTGHGNRWNRERVASLRGHHRIPVYSPEARVAEGWMNLTEAAGHVGVCNTTLRAAVERGEVRAEHPLLVGPWIFRRDELDDPGVRARICVDRRARGMSPGPDHPTLAFTST